LHLLRVQGRRVALWVHSALPCSGSSLTYAVLCTHSVARLIIYMFLLESRRPHFPGAAAGDTTQLTLVLTGTASRLRLLLKCSSSRLYISSVLDSLIWCMTRDRHRRVLERGFGCSDGKAEGMRSQIAKDDVGRGWVIRSWMTGLMNQTDTVASYE